MKGMSDKEKASDVEIHPFDVMTLSKGDWLSPDRCEAVIGVRRDRPQYRLKMLALAEEIARLWHRERSEVVTLTQERDGLLICTDDQAVMVNKERRVQHVRGLERSLVRQGGVDTTKLSTDEHRSLHERELVVGSAFLSAGRKAVRAALKPKVRETPGLPEVKTGAK